MVICKEDQILREEDELKIQEIQKTPEVKYKNKQVINGGRKVKKV